MSRQDKATTERHARTLRELVKRPENKVCADCKKNDPRWASWNLGVYLCIRCSGIHRSMGTHISKVKSIDLDTWTPEQMESIQKWGNRLANIYWEAHLKPGHIPPDHKVESFIRSKYDSRRWAMEGPVPKDPSVLDGGAPAQSGQPSAPPQQEAPLLDTPSQGSGGDFPPPPNKASVNRQPQPHHLLSIAHSSSEQRAAPTSARQPPQSQAPAQQAAPQQPANDLFSLDFHSPASTPQPQVQEQKKDMKNDIMSLFGSSPPASAAQNNTGGFGAFSVAPQQQQQQQPQWGWGQQQPQAQTQQQQQQAPNMMGSGMNAWGSPAAPAPQMNTMNAGWGAPPAQPNVWAAPQQQPQQAGLFGADTSAVWGGSSTGMANGGGQDPFGSFASSTTAAPQKKDDAFGDLWGGFK